MDSEPGPTSGADRGAGERTDPVVEAGTDDGLDAVAGVVEAARVNATRAVVVGVGGPVAVGKSTFADRIAAMLRDRTGAEVAVIATDGFLLPNRELQARGVLDRKGEPETYDRDALERLLRAALDGDEDLVVPVYSHEAYDVLPGGVPLGRPDVIVVEGIVALQEPAVGLLDVCIYLDADPDDLRAWFVARLVAMVDELPEESSSVLSLFRPLDPSARRSAAAATWDAFNVPNNTTNIKPTRAKADVVVTKAGDHRIVDVQLR